MEEGCLVVLLQFLAEGFGGFLLEVLCALWQATWDATSPLFAWLYRDGPSQVRIGARFGALAGGLWGLGWGFCYGPFWILPAPLTGVVLALLLTPTLGLVGGLTGWAAQAAKGVKR